MERTPSIDPDSDKERMDTGDKIIFTGILPFAAICAAVHDFDELASDGEGPAEEPVKGNLAKNSGSRVGGR